MVVAAFLHIVFSEDLAYYKKGYYLKFFHNVMMNSFASIYFHNYLRYDEMPIQESMKKTMKHHNSIDSETGFIDYQRPGLHISTLLRQLAFDTLYTLEFIILLAFGMSSKVKEFVSCFDSTKIEENLGGNMTNTDDNVDDGSNAKDHTKEVRNKAFFIFIILTLTLIALSLRLIYYGVLHVWSNVIRSGKKLIRREIKGAKTNDDTLQLSTNFFKYVFIARNTWILGKLKHIETTLIVLPTRIIGECFKTQLNLPFFWY